MATVKPDATPEQMDEALAGSIQGRQIFAVALTETREVGARTAYTEAQYRNTELREIERSMSEVAQLMNDVSSGSRVDGREVKKRRRRKLTIFASRWERL